MANDTPTEGLMGALKRHQSTEEQGAAAAVQHLALAQQVASVALAEARQGKGARAKKLYDIAGDEALDAGHELKKLAGEIE